MNARTVLPRKDLAVVLVGTVLAALNIGAIGSRGRRRAKEMVCLTNAKHLADAWLLYADDNDGLLVGACTRSAYTRWGDWVLGPSGTGGGSVEGKKQGIRNGALFPYVGNVNVYHCPGDARTFIQNQQAFRSYSIADSMNGEESSSWSYEPARRYGQIRRPATKYVFVEESDGRGWNIGSWVMYPIELKWGDPLANWHNCKTTLGFADGHSQIQRWSDRSTIEMSENQQFNYPIPPDEGQDVRFMSRGYMCRSE